jgi:hypothetical protein
VREATKQIVLAAQSQPHVTPFGRLFLKQMLIQRLRNHVSVSATLLEHPEIRQERIEKPWFIVSFPRTGTTLLHRLLAQDSASRLPRPWEMDQPCPPPTSRTYHTDPRIARAKLNLAILDRLAPGFRAIHALEATEPEECINLFANEIRSVWFLVGLNLPMYAQWMFQQDLVPLYQRHKAQLQLLQWQCPGERWVLKAPQHLLGLGAIFSVYPDARIVMLHRDPVEVVSSEASLFFTMRSAFHDQVDRAALGYEMIEHLGVLMDAALKAREVHSASPFVDLSYREFARDPLGGVRQIYEAFGAPLSTETEARMKNWLANNRQHKHGKHHYSLEEYGLTPDAISRRFATYRERFASYLR